VRNDWLEFCDSLARRKDHVGYCGCRKIFRSVVWDTILDDSLQLADIGYTSNKMKQLERNYFHRESWEMAQTLWDRRKQQGKYGSVGFTTYNHLLKGDIEKKSKRASVMGPCIQAVTLTLVKKGVYEVDVFYRTTEVLKKFPADLIFLRDILLKPFGVEGCKLRCHFANLTLHPMYWVTIMPLQRKPISQLKVLRHSDEHFWKWVVKWTARYMCEEFGHGIEKFSQAKRVRDTSAAKLDNAEAVAKYLRKNHPGYRNQ
jgi:hypothetical protein